MIQNNIIDKGLNECTGCGVCSVVCPNLSISIEYDTEGFYKPVVNNESCTNCGKCKKVCYQYITRPKESLNYFNNKKIYGAWSKDMNTRLTSSSGGISHELFTWGIKNNYKICAVVFDKDAGCKHIIVNSELDLSLCKTSKYLQSYTYDAFSKLNSDDKYMVIGTPCQIFGLRKLIQIQKKENNFILIDFFCHGVPSVNLWTKYLELINIHNSDLESVNFRSKDKASWHNFKMQIETKLQKYNESYLDDKFMMMFLSNICLGSPCYNCLLRINLCSSDIRLGDFWGKKYKNDDLGVSLVVVNTEKGKDLYDAVSDSIFSEESTNDDLANSQPCRFIEVPECRKDVLSLLKESNNRIMDIFNLYFRKNHYKNKVKREIKSFIKIILKFRIS